MALPEGFVPPKGFDLRDKVEVTALQRRRPPARVLQRRTTSLGKVEVTEAWPLIRFLLDEPRYYAAYVRYLRQTVTGPFEPTAIKAKYAKLGALYAPVAAATGTANYQAAVDALATATDGRVKAVQEFLATPAAQVGLEPADGRQ
jgi:hypothetical protein